MARGTAVSGLCNDCAAPRNAEDTQLVAGFLYQKLIAAGLRWWLEDAIGSAGNVVFGTVHPNIGFHFVIVRCQVLIGDGPVITTAIARVRFEIPLGHAQRDSRPLIC